MERGVVMEGVNMGIYSHRAGKTSGQMGCAQGETLARGVQGMQQQCKGARVKSAKATTRRRRVNKRAKQQQGGGGSISAQSNKNAKKNAGVGAHAKQQIAEEGDRHLYSTHKNRRRCFRS